MGERIEFAAVTIEDLNRPCERLFKPRMNTSRQIRIAIKHGGRILVIAVKQWLYGAEAERALSSEPPDPADTLPTTICSAALPAISMASMSSR